ncbi:hypothetical protein C0J52_08126 [Blattella germanica]|nr:hypothetical protein C0J52_08126 [Blattella germanica]
MDFPQVFKLKQSEKSEACLEDYIMKTVRPRRTSIWGLYNRHTDSAINHIHGTKSTQCFKFPLRKSTLDPSFISNNELPSKMSAIREKEKLNFCNNVNWTETWTGYSQKSSLHGLKYVGDVQLHFLERIFWSVAFVLAVITSGYYITILYQKWDENPVIVSIGAKATQLIDIPFPAVTICTMSKAKKSSAQEINFSVNASETHKELLNYVCDDDFQSSSNDVQSSAASGNWETIQAFMTHVKQPCHEMVILCYYAGVIQNCVNIFNPSLTDEGICCSFNKVKRDLIFRNPRDLSDLNVTFPIPAVDWTPEDGYPTNTPTGTLPWRPRGAGSHLGLTLLLDAIETPKVSEFGYIISPGKEYRVVISPTIMNASASLRGIPKNKRQCLFSNEKYLKFYRTYTQRNCALECEANYTLETCGCVPYYLPKDTNTTICGQKEQICAISAKKTIEMRLIDEHANTSNEFLNSEGLSNTNCQCLPGCSELSYQAALSSTRISETFNVRNEYLVNSQRNQSYFRKNIAVVNFFFTESQFINYRKSELFGFTEFLSNTGGLLGLFLGFSFLSAVEVAYFISLRLWCSVNQKNQHSASQSSSILMTNANDIKVAPYPFAQ